MAQQAPMPQHYDRPLSGTQAVIVANKVAASAARDTPIRALAAEITSRCSHLPTEAPLVIADWIRRNIEYRREAGEILTGPYSLLRGEHAGWTYSGIGAGDCDDLAMLWAALNRAVGLRAFVVGLAQRRSRAFYHAVGGAGGFLYELTDDAKYRPPGTLPSQPLPIILNGSPSSWGLCYDPDLRRLVEYDALAPLAHPIALQGMAGGLNVGGLVQRGLQGLNGVGIDPAGVFDDLAPEGVREVVGTITSIVGSAATGGTVAAVAGASAPALSAIFGSSAALGPIGMGIAAGAAALVAVGKALSNQIKARRSASRAANRYEALLDFVAEIGAQPEQRAIIRQRLDEIVPVLAGTYGTKGPKGRVRMGSYGSVRRPVTEWLTGGRKARRGVGVVLGVRAPKARDVMQDHLTYLRAFAEGLAKVPLAERQRTITGTIAAAQRALGGTA